MRTSASICILLLSLCLAPAAWAKKEKEVIPPAPLFCGAAVKADLAGPVMKVLDTNWNQLEVGARLNFRDHYFPICELGIGECGREGRKTDTHFFTRAPYFRVGLDYNIIKKHNGNRFFLGLRYGFSSFKYDYSDPDFNDPVWPSASNGLNLKGVPGKQHWGEACVGVETKLWKFIRLGWTMRYKFRMKQGNTSMGEPYYVPGFGKNGGSCFGGTVNLVFDVGKKNPSPTLPRRGGR